MSFKEEETKGNYDEYKLAINQTASAENIALFKSTIAGSLTGVKEALLNGARPNYFFRPEDSKNALHIAAEAGFTDIARELIDHGAVVDALCVTTKSTALHFATAEGHNPMVTLLIKNGAEINISNSFGNTPLHEAARRGDVEMIRKLLEAGANILATNKKGSTALNFACYDEKVSHRSYDIVAELLKRGSPINAKDNSGMTPFLITCMSGRLDLMDLLIQEGADIRVRDNNNRNGREVGVFYHQEAAADKVGLLLQAAKK